MRKRLQERALRVAYNDFESSFAFFFSMRVFFHEHSQITGLQGKGEDISLTSHYHFYIASNRTLTGNL